MTLTVLTDDQIRSLLENLTAAELEDFRGALASALHEDSTGSADSETSAMHQPERTSVHNNATGATTLFMPSCNAAGNAVKVITLTSAANQPSAGTGNTSSGAENGNKPVIRPTGAIALFTSHGAPLGLLHASTLTAFRTALASLCLVRRRRFSPTPTPTPSLSPSPPPPAPPAATAEAAAAGTAVLVAFGCGEQAYWHVRLTLLARGADVGRVVFISRRASSSGAATLARFAAVAPDVKEREGWAGVGFELLLPTRGKEGEEKVAEVLGQADVVFCCTPSTEPLFDAAALSSGSREGKGRLGKGWLVVAIGSYTPEMREVPGELVRQAVAGGEQEAGVVVVDTIDGALKEAGELIEAGVRPEQLVELGEVVMLGESASSEARGQGMTASRAHLAEWLEKGNVIYKSVGMGLMDLSVGLYMVRFGQEKGVGTHVQGF